MTLISKKVAAKEFAAATNKAAIEMAEQAAEAKHVKSANNNQWSVDKNGRRKRRGLSFELP